MGGTSSLLQALQELGTYNTLSPFIAPIPQILPIPCVILCCPSALLPIYHTVSPFSAHFLLFSDPLMHSNFPQSSQSCCNINSPPMPSAPHPTWLVASCQGTPLLTAGLQGAKASASHGQVSFTTKSKNCGERTGGGEEGTV